MLLIKDGTVHVGNGEVLTKCDVLIKNGKIVEVKQGIKCENAKVIESDGYHLFPGFIDPNSSIGAMGIPTRFFDNNERTNPIMPEMNLRYSVDPDEINAQEFYKSGIITIGLAPGNSNVMGGQIVVCKTAPEKMKNRIVKEKAALKCSVNVIVKESYGSSNKLPMTKMGIFNLLKESIYNSKTTREEERDAKQKIIYDVFENKGMPLFVAASSKSEMNGVLEMLKDKNLDLTFVDGFGFSENMEEMKKTKAGLILGNLSRFDQVAKHEIDMSKLVELNENGNLIAFTNTCEGFSEGRESFIWTAIDVYRSGVDAEQVVKMMTLNPAKMLKIDDRVGSIEVGKSADISIYTGHVVESYQAKAKHVIVNGEVLF